MVMVSEWQLKILSIMLTIYNKKNWGASPIKMSNKMEKSTEKDKPLTINDLLEAMDIITKVYQDAIEQVEKNEECKKWL